MKYRISGTTMQSLDVLLEKSEALVTETGGMAWYKGQVDMKTNMPGGLMGGLGRALSGESVFMTTYTATSDQVVITFTPEAPGSIVPMELTQGQVIIAQRLILGVQGAGDDLLCVIIGTGNLVEDQQEVLVRNLVAVLIDAA